VVSAVNGGGQGPDSTPTAAITLRSVAPTGLGATPGNGQVSLSWNASSGATSYNVYRGTSSGTHDPTPLNGSPVNSTTYTDTGLTNGTAYYYVVSAVNSGGESGTSGEASATPEPTAPGVPSGLIASRGDRQVSLTWNAVSGAASYNVKRSTIAGGPYSTISGPSGTLTTTSYIDTGLTNGTTYYYVVSAVNGGGESANSTQVSGTPQPAIPAAPTGLAATPGNNQVALSWTAPAGAASYNVKRSTTSGSGYATISGPAGTLTTTSFIDPGAVNGTTYYYVVTAQNGGGESANSAQVSATPQPPIPAAPTALTPTPGSNQVALSWTAPAGPVTSYNVKRGTVSGGPYTTISTAGSVTTTSYTDSSALNGTTYYYVVSAVNGGGEGPNSTQASATPTGTRTLVFSDGFETGNLSKWTTNGGLTVQSVVKHTGTYGAQGNTTNGATYAKKLLATTYTDGYFRIWFYLASGYTAQVNVLRYRTAADASIGYLYVATTGKLTMKSDISAVITTSATSVTSNAWHALELHLVVNGTSSSTEVWLDNVKVNDLSLSGQNWGTTPIGKVQIGEVQSGRTYNVTFDDVAFDTAQIGLLPVP
jgi:fibronectin type 3 domain-containing protein